MDISRSRFPLELVKIIQLIADSHFVALDLEFSGIPGRRKDRRKPTLQEVYEDVKEAAEQYQVLQVGLTVVHEDLLTGRYTARPYNFNINPIPASERLRFERVWSFQSGAVDFLLRNDFDFGVPLTRGIPYLSRDDEEDIRAAWIDREEEKAALNDMPIKQEDEFLINYVRACVQKWHEEPAVNRETFLNIPDTSDGGIPFTSASQTLNRYQSRLVHQIVRNEHPKLKTAGKGHFIQITAFDETKDHNERLLQARFRDRDISRAVEFRWLIEAISGGDITNMPSEHFTAAFASDAGRLDGADGALQRFIDNLQQKLNTRRRILVGHNCFMDLVYLYSCFIGQLPDKVDKFRELVRQKFPAVIDTKFMASFDKGVPQVEVPVEFDRYTVGQRLHEAGFDSLLTAKIAVKLSAKLEKEGKFPAYHAEETSLTTDDDASEHYSTAPESIGDSDADSLAVTLKHALSTPVTAISNLFRSDLASAGQQFANHDDCDISDQLEDLMVFSDTGEDGGEEERLTEATAGVGELTRTTVSESPEVDGAPVLKSKPTADPPLSKTLTESDILGKVAKGELMPRWEGGRGFWQYFGKKLQVNSAEERICRL